MCRYMISFPVQSVLPNLPDLEMPITAQVLHNGMKYRKIPHSDLSVSEIGLGTMNFGDQLTKRSSLELLDHATKEYAINFIVSS